MIQAVHIGLAGLGIGIGLIFETTWKDAGQSTVIDLKWE